MHEQARSERPETYDQGTEAKTFNAIERDTHPCPPPTDDEEESPESDRLPVERTHLQLAWLIFED